MTTIPFDGARSVEQVAHLNASPITRPRPPSCRLSEAALMGLVRAASPEQFPGPNWQGLTSLP
jgi:hypothetical protein